MCHGMHHTHMWSVYVIVYIMHMCHPYMSWYASYTYVIRICHSIHHTHVSSVYVIVYIMHMCHPHRSWYASYTYVIRICHHMYRHFLHHFQSATRQPKEFGSFFGLDEFWLVRNNNKYLTYISAGAENLLYLARNGIANTFAGRLLRTKYKKNASFANLHYTIKKTFQRALQVLDSEK